MSLRARLFAACLGVLALAMGLMGSALIAGAFEFELAQARQALTARGGDVARAMEAAAAMSSFAATKICGLFCR